MYHVSCKSKKSNSFLLSKKSKLRKFVKMLIFSADQKYFLKRVHSAAHVRNADRQRVGQEDLAKVF